LPSAAVQELSHDRNKASRASSKWGAAQVC
jgi:hypothetical protein